MQSYLAYPEKCFENLAGKNKFLNTMITIRNKIHHNFKVRLLINSVQCGHICRARYMLNVFNTADSLDLINTLLRIPFSKMKWHACRYLAAII